MFPRFCGPKILGRILGRQTFRAAGVIRILPTHTFSGGRDVAFYLHTFRAAGVLHFTYTHFRGDSYAKSRKITLKFKQFQRCARAILYQIQKKMGYISKKFRAACAILLSNT